MIVRPSWNPSREGLTVIFVTFAVKISSMPANPDVISIICGGCSLLSSVDAEGVLASFFVTEVFHASAETSARGSVWRCGCRNVNGAELRLSGSLSGTGAFSLTGISVPSVGSPFEEFVFPPVSGVSAALKTVDGLADRLRPIIKNKGRFRRIVGPVRWSRDLFVLEGSAAFHNVEGGSPKDGFRERFPVVRVCYSYDEHNVPCRADMEFRSPVENGRVSLKVSVGPNVPACRTVVLDKDLGLGRSVSCGCVCTAGPGRFPSLPVAFDIAGLLGTVYVKQKRKGQKMGKPKAKLKEK